MWKKFNNTRKITGDSLIDSVLEMNGISTIEEYERKLNVNYLPFEIDSMPFINFIDEAKSKNKKVVIVGDYDVDGVSATSIMKKFFDSLNIINDWIVPNRFINGYGLKEPLVDLAITKGADFIITVDNGIKSKSAISYALKKGLKVLVTDHHQPDENVPENVFIINPHYKNEKLIFKDICGAELSYILVNNYLKFKNIKNDELISEIKELASIATIADVMPLYYGNRFLVKEFIECVRNGNLKNKGIKKLIELAKINIKNFNTEDIGFLISPILNASGRMDDASNSVNLLIENDEEKIEKYGNLCFDLNLARKNVTKELIAEVSLNESDLIHIVCFEKANEGIIGIISGEITEQTVRPSFVFTKTSSGTYKGSGRSPLNYNLINGATRVLSKHPELVLGFGGHAGAMGITLKDYSSVIKFKELMNEDYRKENPTELNKMFINFFKDSDDMSVIFNKLEKLEPFGEGLQKPTFRTFGFPSFIKDVGDGSSFCLLNDNYKYINFIQFKKKVEKGLQEIFFNINRELYKEKTYYKGTVIEIRKKQK